MSTTIAKKKIVQVVDDLFNGDTELALFFAAWLENDRNATRAYKQLHPTAQDSSCRVLGSKVLAKIDKSVIYEAYNLNPDRYLTKIDKGLDAQKRDQYTGEEKDDHITQISYHDKLGNLLEIEGKDGRGISVQVNTVVMHKRESYGI